ncbi:TetR/AcrR family transcriptional regulator [Advenella mimigardefordensis]|uniref:Transcriptional regulator, TetR family n=1 Tax=Advenella mimigardefordensis (strain DSM 17166 / LMG 22922 / DPN7) TaxID=1247726 RepID=W0P606_ADVMD|nr:TetR family transcriptional regulator [Advenella mimigardefordensis]AHG62289.1 transcriptional regulator, TetR family [Advenella mimigardefordensis DPN7]
MGRSSRQQAEHNRAEILNAASRLFRERGVDNVSITDVMTAVGLTAGGFYRHFASKEALVNEVLSTVFAQSSEKWKQTCDSNQNASQGALQVLIQQYLRKKQAAQTCPILAFAPHVSHEAAGTETVDLYGSYTETLFQQFRGAAMQATSQDGKTAMSEQEILVLFAAMVGTGFLAQSVHDQAWIESLKAAVLGAVGKSDS